MKSFSIKQDLRNKGGRRCVSPAASMMVCVCLAAWLTSCRPTQQTLVIDGRTVERVETRWGLFYGLPFTGKIAREYYRYRDDSGKLVLHGPYRMYNPDGKLTSEEFYRDGRLNGTSTYWDQNGTAIQFQEFWRNGVKAGEAQYSRSGGHLQFYNEDIYQDSEKVAHKSYSYETGLWALCSYAATDLAIDSRGGQLFHSSRDVTPRCEPGG